MAQAIDCMGDMMGHCEYNVHHKISLVHSVIHNILRKEKMKRDDVHRYTQYRYRTRIISPRVRITTITPIGLIGRWVVWRWIVSSIASVWCIPVISSCTHDRIKTPK